MSALSHDARTPLNAVVLSAKLLESQVKDQDDPEVRECLRTIRNAVRNVLDLLSDLLDLSRIDAGATRAESSRFALKPTLAECLSSIEPQARAKGLDVRLESGEPGRRPARDRPGEAQADPLEPPLQRPAIHREGPDPLLRRPERGPDPDRRRGHRGRDRRGRPADGSSTNSPSSSIPTESGARGPAWAWPSAADWRTSSRGRSS